jgi:transcriptional regulator with XRE-family HTH domain
VTGDRPADDGAAGGPAATLAGEIRRLRKAANLSQVALARRVGFTRQYVSLAERTTHNLPSAELVRHIDDALGADGALIALRNLAREEQRSRRLSPRRTTHPTDTVRDTQGNANLDADGQPEHLAAVAWTWKSVTDAALKTTRDDLAATRRQALVLAGAVLTGPLQRWLDPASSGSPVARTATASGFTPPEVVALEGLADQLRGLARHGTGALARKAVVAQLADQVYRIRNAPSSELKNRVTIATAQLAETVASMSWDEGDHGAAQRYYVLAAKLGKVAGDSVFTAVALAGLARQCYDLNRPSDGLDIIQLAQYATRRIPSPRMRAMLASRESWAYAQQGEVHAFHRAVGLAQDFFAEPEPDEPSRWVRNFDRAEMHGVIGARFRDLALHDPSQARHAQKHIELALDLRDANRPRNRAFDLTGLARTYLIANEPEHAAKLAHDAIAVGRPWARGRVGVKLRDFSREARRYSDVPAIRNTQEAIRESTA